MKCRQIVSLVLACAVVAVGLGVAGPPAGASYPGTNGLLAFSSGGQAWLARPDGTGGRAVTPPRPPDSFGGAGGAVWSPDGSKLLVVWADGCGTACQHSLYVVNPDGSNFRRLTGSLTIGDVHATWAPDGRTIAVSANNEISLFDADGTNARPLVKPGDGPAWSPTGDRIAYHGDGGIWTVHPDGTAPTQLTNDGGMEPEWSPDGAQLFYAVRTGTPSDQTAAVYRIRADGTGRTLTPFDDVPVWSPDGTRIAYTRPVDGGTSRETVIAKPDGSDATVVPNVPSVESWQPRRTDQTTTRVAGADRIDTAIAISHSGHDTGGASAAVLARADGFADALAGTPLAAARHAPLLLTPHDHLDARVEAELERVVSPGSTVYLLGGEAALSTDVEQDVASAGFDVRRLAGTDRYGTAAAIAAELGDVSTIFLTTGADFPDALSAGNAAALAGDSTVVLTAGDTLPQATRAYLDAHPSAARIAVGGPAARADSTAAPIVGRDRYDTAALVAGRFARLPAVAALASGETFSDALAGGADAAARQAPLLLTTRDDLPAATHAYLDERSTAINRVTVYGGTAAVGDVPAYFALLAFG
jgi:glycosyltransferase A (GT-A) superfamily protein (DUF2064 family)